MDNQCRGMTRNYAEAAVEKLCESRTNQQQIHSATIALAKKQAGGNNMSSTNIETIEELYKT